MSCFQQSPLLEGLLCYIILNALHIVVKSSPFYYQYVLLCIIQFQISRLTRAQGQLWHKGMMDLQRKEEVICSCYLTCHENLTLSLIQLICHKFSLGNVSNVAPQNLLSYVSEFIEQLESFLFIWQLGLPNRLLSIPKFSNFVLFCYTWLFSIFSGHNDKKQVKFSWKEKK